MKHTLLILAMLLPFAGIAQEKKEVKSDSTKKEKKKNKDLPLEPGRKIRIQSDQGSWMSLDVSPDGKTIAFDFLGDIYLLPMSGGQAQQFTKGMSFDSHPKFFLYQTEVELKMFGAFQSTRKTRCRSQKEAPTMFNRQIGHPTGTMSLYHEVVVILNYFYFIKMVEAGLNLSANPII